MWLNAGVSAAGSGVNQSTYTMYTIDDIFTNTSFAENTPAPTLVYKDPTNTANHRQPTGAPSNETGQIPGITTRRDAHGAIATLDDSYVHNVDRIRNNVEVFNAASLQRTTYDLVSADGQGGGVGPCEAASVTDDPALPTNDPAPDLMGVEPNGKYLVVALRGQTPSL